MIVGNEGDEAAIEIGQQSFDGGSPDIFACGFGCKQHNPFSLVHHHSLNDHQPDVGLAESNAVAKKGTAI